MVASHAYGPFFVEQQTSATMSPGSYTMLSLDTERDCDARYVVPNTYPTLIYHTATVTIPGGGVVVLHDNFDLECGLYTGQFDVTHRNPSTCSRRSNMRPRRSNYQARSRQGPRCAT